MILVNKLGKFELFNRKAAEIFEYDREDFKQLSIETILPTCADRKEDFDINCVKSCIDENNVGVLNGVKKNGALVPIHIEFTSLRIKEEDLTLVVIIDMSRQVEIEHALEESRNQLRLDRDKYQSAFENINDALFIIEVDNERFRFIEFNIVAEEITSISNEQIKGKYTEELFPKLADYLNWRYASCRDSAEIVTYEEKLNFVGVEHDFQTSLVPILKDGKVIRIIGIAHEITELKKSQNVIKEREEKLRFALEAAQDAIIDWDFTSGMVDVSPVLYRMLGYRINTVNEHILGIVKLINKSDLEGISEQEFIKQIQHLGEKQFAQELRMKCFDGSWLWVLMRGKVVKSETGQALRFIGTVSDISKEKQKTKEKLEAILQTEDNERRRISREIHDGLQQTLTISALNMEFLKREISQLSEISRKKYEQGWEYLQKAISESRGVAHTLMPKAIVDFGLISACNSLIMEYNNSVEGVFFHFEHNFSEETSFDQSIEVTLYRILQEALNNIIKYAKATEVNVQLRDYTDILMLTIEDNGKGFDLEKVKSEDRGLGLKSMQNRINAISGILEIDSAPGKGTVVLVEISKDILTEV